MSDREDGYYWIRLPYTDWMIGQWISERWNIIGTESQFKDSDIKDIDENVIARRVKV